MSLNGKSKFLSYVLRYKPEEFGLTLSDGGWVSVEALMKACNFTKEELEKIVLQMKRKDIRLIIMEILEQIKDILLWWR